MRDAIGARVQMGSNGEADRGRSDHRFIMEPRRYSSAHRRQNTTAVAPGVFVPG